MPTEVTICLGLRQSIFPGASLTAASCWLASDGPVVWTNIISSVYTLPALRNTNYLIAKIPRLYRFVLKKVRSNSNAV